ncbi:rod shape-determining protein RodA [Candidatus Microgenomates bacterium]|nr:rod shape-determining protein RodA [Candidatus Microgenomates bacterium]
MTSKEDGILVSSITFLLFIGTSILYSVKQDLFPIQAIYIISAILIFWFFSRLDKIILETVAPIFYVVTVLFLLITLAIGALSHGAVRWLPLGPITIQPSEFAKPILVLMAAWILSRRTKYGFLISLFLSFLVAILVFIQPDLGTSVLLAAAWFGAVLASGTSLKKVFLFLGSLVLLLPLFWLILAPYQKQRITSFISPTDTQGASYQSVQSMISAGSGGLFGRGLGQGSQTQLDFLPERHTDFIFASAGEELGFVGMGLIVVGFFVLFWRLLTIFGRQKDIFSKTVIGGIFFYLFLQVFINIAMNLGMVPIAGVPLPLVSAGGSALLSTMMSLGIVVALRK